MSIAFEDISDFQSGNGTSFTLTWPGTANGQLRIMVVGVEGVTATVPHIVSAADSGWVFLMNADSTNGFEVWFHNSWTTGTTSAFTLKTTYNYAARGALYNGLTYDGVTNMMSTAFSAGGTGNNPATSTMSRAANDMLIGIMAETLASPGFGTPTASGGGAMNVRFDDARASTFGNIEITLADRLEASSTSAAVAWTATASPAGAGYAGGITKIPATFASTPPAFFAQVI